MKKFVGLAGLFLITMYGWAAPEKMEMYATLSAPIASFWGVKTEGCQAVTMPANSSLNLGPSSSAQGGTIKITGKNKPLSIGTLRMEKGTRLQITGVKWFVNTINLYPTGTLSFELGNSEKGALIIDTLNFANGYSSITMKATSLRVDKNVETTNGSFYSINTNDGAASCSNGAFCFSSISASEPANATWGTVGCSKNENNACESGRYWLVGG